MIKRLFIRTMQFAILTVLAIAAQEWMVYLGHEQISDINERFPEIVCVLVAVAVLAWGEISIMWFRVLMAPELDVQKIAKQAADESPQAAATIYAAKQFVWAVRLAAFLFLYWIQLR